MRALFWYREFGGSKMLGYEKDEALRYMMKHLKKKEFKPLEGRLEEILSEFIDLDMTFMLETGVLDETGAEGENEYDDDEAIEYIYDGWLALHPDEKDEDLLIAQLLDEYLQLQYEYLCSVGLA